MTGICGHHVYMLSSHVIYMLSSSSCILHDHSLSHSLYPKIVFPLFVGIKNMAGKTMMFMVVILAVCFCVLVEGGEFSLQILAAACIYVYSHNTNIYYTVFHSVLHIYSLLSSF